MMADTFAPCVPCTIGMLPLLAVHFRSLVRSNVLMPSRMFRLQAGHGTSHCVGASAVLCRCVWPGQRRHPNESRMRCVCCAVLPPPHSISLATGACACTCRQCPHTVKLAVFC